MPDLAPEGHSRVKWKLAGRPWEVTDFLFSLDTRASTGESG